MNPMTSTTSPELPNDKPQEAPAYDAVFFDLDGTLLPIDMPEFLGAYYQVLDVAAGRAGYDTTLFADALNAGMVSMGNHAPDCTNADAFWEVFYAHLFPQGATAEQRQQAERFIDDFYTHDFNLVGEGITPDPAAAQALHTLQAKGYPLFLCTMPLFPLQGVLSRLEWAGVDPAAFERITTYDSSTDIKPREAYYHENVQLAGVAPERILMVGNDTGDDLSCLQLGMDAYLITDHLIDRGNLDISTVKQGSLADFAAWVEALPDCTSRTAFAWRERADALRLGQPQDRSWAGRDSR